MCMNFQTIKINYQRKLSLTINSKTENNVASYREHKWREKLEIKPR